MSPNAEWVSSYAFMQSPASFLSYLSDHTSLTFDIDSLTEKYETFYKADVFHKGHTIELIRWCKEDSECTNLIKELHRIAVLPHDIVLEPGAQSPVDIIIPCYNLGHLIEDTLASIERSFNDNMNVCIIDDGSTEAASIEGLKKAEAYGYKVIWQTNTGLCKALNNVIEQTSNEYLLVLSSDDKVDPKFITQSIQLLNERNDVGVVYCNPKTFEAWYSMWQTPDFDAAQFLSLNFIVATSMYRRKYWIQSGGYDLEIGGNEDWEMWMNCLELGAAFYHINEYLFHYRYRIGSKIQAAYKPDSRRKIVSYLCNKHQSLYAKFLPEIMGNLHYAIAKFDQSKTTDHLEVEMGATRLGLLGSLMYRTLRKIGHLTLKRNRTF